MKKNIYTLEICITFKDFFKSQDIHDNLDDISFPCNSYVTWKFSQLASMNGPQRKQFIEYNENKL